MTFQYRFERLMKVGESEKKQLEQVYQELFQLLEAQGQRLIELMKKKEILTNQFDKQKEKKVTVMDARNHLNILESIGNKILAEQEKYNTIRDRLDKFKASLLDKAIELKKYEKLKEIHFNQYSSEMKRLEREQMDEAAIKSTHKQ